METTTLRFSRVANNISVDYKATLTDENDVDENFRVGAPSNINSYLETQIFYFFDRKKWTLNEMIFFANNNNLCLTIYDKQGEVVKQYGACSGVCLGEFKINNDCFIVNNKFLQIN